MHTIEPMLQSTNFYAILMHKSSTKWLVAIRFSPGFFDYCKCDNVIAINAQFKTCLNTFCLTIDSNCRPSMQWETHVHSFQLQTASSHSSFYTCRFSFSQIELITVFVLLKCDSLVYDLFGFIASRSVTLIVDTHLS